MGFINDRVLDSGLGILPAESNRLDICHTPPTTYAQATSTYTVAYKTSPSIGSPVARSPTGRKVVVAAISGGTVTYTSTSAADDAQYWAISDTANSRLLAAGDLAAAQYVTSGNTFTLTSFDIGIPGPA